MWGYAVNAFPKEPPIIYEGTPVTVNMNGKSINVTFFDYSAREDCKCKWETILQLTTNNFLHCTIDHNRTQFLKNIHVFVVCFSVVKYV